MAASCRHVFHMFMPTIAPTSRIIATIDRRITTRVFRIGFSLPARTDFI
jgi:hypothetical protein